MHVFYHNCQTSWEYLGVKGQEGVMEVRLSACPGDWEARQAVGEALFPWCLRVAPVVSAADTAGVGMQHGGMMVMWEYALGFYQRLLSL